MMAGGNARYVRYIVIAIFVSFAPGTLDDFTLDSATQAYQPLLIDAPCFLLYFQL